MLEDRGALPSEDGDLLPECHAMHEENFLSSWLREDVAGKEEERERLNKEAKEEGRTNGKREEEGDRERVEIQRICLDHVSSKAFEALCPNSEEESFGDSSESSGVCARFLILLMVPAVVFPF